ncbi:MAG TPA: malic enzyme-like NAD(P)-binding protein [Miltoncostaeaceae bacterium]|nr:malic enzyme-like NAD(P)-binding protein [Miltoncostaeaceae bacterium]
MSHVNYSLTIRAAIRAEIGMLGRVLAAIGDQDGLVGGVDIVHSSPSAVTRDITVLARDQEHGEAIRDAVAAIDGVTIEHATDRVVLAHTGGSIGMRNRVPLVNRDDLSMAYTPGVARVCMAIHDDVTKAWDYTIKGSSVMVTSDGSSVVGQGDLGALAALPVLEAKCAMLNKVARIDAFPLPVTVREPQQIADVIARCSSVYAGIQLSDISAPRCFEVQRLLDERLDIPVFHDDAQGTAAVILAGLTNALSITGVALKDATVVLAGLGPAGLATARLLSAAGVGNLIAADSHGAIHPGRDDLTDDERWIAAHTNPAGRTGDVRTLIEGAHAFIGLSVPDLLSGADIETMAADPVVFALANPSPELAPSQAQGRVRVYATGRPDVPNQINSGLASPGIWRGALDVRATTINQEMVLAAARAIAETAASGDTLSEAHVVPSFFNPRLVDNVAAAVRAAAQATGVARVAVAA